MASANCGGTLKIYAVSPSGQRILTHQYENGGVISAGGSPDGVPASKTADLMLYMNRYDGITLTGGWKVVLTVTLKTSDGLDASDSWINLPISVRGAGVQTLTSSELAYSVDYPASSPISVELPIGAGYTIPNGQEVRIGGAPAMISIENDS